MSATVCWVWPVVPNHAQICLNLSGVILVGLGGGMARLKIVQNEIFIKWYRNQSAFSSIYPRKLQVID